MWWLLLLPTLAWSQDDLDLKAIQDLSEVLPDTEIIRETSEDIPWEKANRRFLPTVRAVKFDEIKRSGIETGFIEEGQTLIRTKDGSRLRVYKSIYSRYYRKQDEQGFKYLVNADGSTTFKITDSGLTLIKQETALYEPPTRYTPAPKLTLTREYDQKLKLLPMVSLHSGLVQGDYMKDLFNDSKSSSGVTVQYGLHLMAEWKAPIKAGLVINYETTTYDFTAGKINYSSISFGPEFKTRDFDTFGFPMRFQTQFRVSPFARATAETAAGGDQFKFNSTDLHASIEFPIKNGFGAFVWGPFVNAQWLSLKDQDKFVDVKASNELNKTLGLTISQVFE